MSYPQESGKPHEYGSGVCIKYQAAFAMPYLEAEAEASYDFECGLFLLARLNLISFKADGREKDYAYAGPML